MSILNEGDNPHLFFALGALQRIYLVDSLIARNIDRFFVSYRPPYVPPPEVWGGGGYPSSGPSSPTPKSTTETSQSKTEVPLVVVLFVLGLFVVVPIGCVIWMLVQVFDF